MKKLVVILILLVATCGLVAGARTIGHSRSHIAADSEAPL